jgi:hypothetical protein
MRGSRLAAVGSQNHSLYGHPHALLSFTHSCTWRPFPLASADIASKTTTHNAFPLTHLEACKKWGLVGSLSLYFFFSRLVSFAIVSLLKDTLTFNYLKQSLTYQLMESRNDIVLSDLSNFLGGDIQDGGTQQRHEEQNHHEFSLPPADRGKGAILFLAAGFVVEALVWGQFLFFPPSGKSNRGHAMSQRCTDLFAGFPFSFGVFQEYYTTHEPFASEPSGIAIIGTTATVWNV